LKHRSESIAKQRWKGEVKLNVKSMKKKDTVVEEKVAEEEKCHELP